MKESELVYREHKILWKEIFGDADKYIDFYFGEKAERSRVYSRYEEGRLASMAFFTPYEVIYRGRECVCPCIVGVATRPEYRHRGYMRALLKQGLREAAQSGCEVAFLCPVDERIYEPLGFRGVQYRISIEADAERVLSDGLFSVRPFSVLTQEERESAVDFTAERLRAANFDLYRKRDIAYYELLGKELAALDGEVIVLWEGDSVRGVAAYIYEDGCFEVTETICGRGEGQCVFEAVCGYVRAVRGGEGSDAAAIRFSDSEFLGQVAGEGIVRKRETLPYTMLRELSGVSAGGLSVYINDIT